jgi:hypothetical protein
MEPARRNAELTADIGDDRADRAAAYHRVKPAGMPGGYSLLGGQSCETRSCVGSVRVGSGCVSFARPDVGRTACAETWG